MVDQSLHPTPAGRVLEAFGVALWKRDREALESLLAHWTSVEEAAKLICAEERLEIDHFEVLEGEAELAEVADRLPRTICAEDFVTWGALWFFRAVPGGGEGVTAVEAAVVEIAGGLYIGHWEIPT